MLPSAVLQPLTSTRERIAHWIKCGLLELSPRSPSTAKLAPRNPQQTNDNPVTIIDPRPGYALRTKNCFFPASRSLPLLSAVKNQPAQHKELEVAQGASIDATFTTTKLSKIFGLGSR